MLVTGGGARTDEDLVEEQLVEHPLLEVVAGPVEAMAVLPQVEGELQELPFVPSRASRTWRRGWVSRRWSYREE